MVNANGSDEKDNLIDKFGFFEEMVVLQSMNLFQNPFWFRTFTAQVWLLSGHDTDSESFAFHILTV